MIGFIRVLQEDEEYAVGSISKSAVQNYLSVVRNVLERAESISTKAARKMVKDSSSTNSSAEYTIGTQVKV